MNGDRKLFIMPRRQVDKLGGRHGNIANSSFSVAYWWGYYFICSKEDKKYNKFRYRVYSGFDVSYTEYIRCYKKMVFYVIRQGVSLAFFYERSPYISYYLHVKSRCFYVNNCRTNNQKTFKKGLFFRLIRRIIELTRTKEVKK